MNRTDSAFSIEDPIKSRKAGSTCHKCCSILKLLFKIVFGTIAGISIAFTLASIVFYALGKVEFHSTGVHLTWANPANVSGKPQSGTDTTKVCENVAIKKIQGT